MQDFEWIFKKENMQQKVNFELSHQIYLPTLFTSFKRNGQICSNMFWGFEYFCQRSNFLLRLRFLFNSLLIPSNLSQLNNFNMIFLFGIISPGIQISSFLLLCEEKKHLSRFFALGQKLCHNLELICKSGLEHNPIS